MNKVKIKVCDECNLLLNYLVSNNIYYSSLVKDKNNYYLIVDYDNYKRISRRFDSIIISYYGKNKIKSFILYNKSLIISIIIGLLLLYHLCNTIFDIRINTSDKDLYNKIMKSLNDNGIVIHKRKKSFDEINSIKNKILKENEDVLEWIEIEENGCVYIVNLTKRVKNNTSKNNEPWDIVASKDGLIKHVVVYSGTKMKSENDYVKKGEVIVSGNIIKDENIVDSVASSAEVYAEVWYVAKVSIPFEYNKRVKTGKVINRYYFNINNKEFTLIGKYNGGNYESEKSIILDKIYLPFKLYKEKMILYENNSIKLDYNSAYNEGIKICEEEIKKNLRDGEYIISKKTLKKDVNSSKMYLEVSFDVYEHIGVTSNITNIEEDSASSS